MLILLRGRGLRDKLRAAPWADESQEGVEDGVEVAFRAFIDANSCFSHMSATNSILFDFIFDFQLFNPPVVAVGSKLAIFEQSSMR